MSADPHLLADTGFVAAPDARTLRIPERKGNRMVLALQNLLANRRVALIFPVPGTEQTLRGADDEVAQDIDRAIAEDCEKNR